MIDPLTMGVVAGVAGNVIGGGASMLMSEGASDELRAAIEQQKILDPEAYVANYERYVQQGLINPEQEADILAGETAMADIKSDPQYKDAQIEALTRMSRIGREGMLLQDRAELDKLREQTSSELRGQQQAVMQNRAARGLAGSGDELAMQMANAQAAATQQAQADRDIAAQAQSRKLNAIAQTGSMSGQMEEAEYGRASNLASAMDRFKQFDVANRIGTQQRNVGSRNTAQEANLSAKQRIADMNVGLKNTQADQLVAGRLANAKAVNTRASDLGTLTKKDIEGRAQAVGKMLGSTGDTVMAGGKTISDNDYRNAAAKGTYFKT